MSRSNTSEARREAREPRTPTRYTVSSSCFFCAHLSRKKYIESLSAVCARRLGPGTTSDRGAKKPTRMRRGSSVAAAAEALLRPRRRACTNTTAATSTASARRLSTSAGFVVGTGRGDGGGKSPAGIGVGVGVGSYCHRQQKHLRRSCDFLTTTTTISASRRATAATTAFPKSLLSTSNSSSSSIPAAADDEDDDDGPTGDLLVFPKDIGPSLVSKRASIKRSFGPRSNAAALLTCGGEALAAHASFDPDYERARGWIRQHAV